MWSKRVDSERQVQWTIFRQGIEQGIDGEAEGGKKIMYYNITDRRM
ncbi:MAG: hypothetical protein O7C59_12320 [Rickettsia endosymbiont of Ixodes persulcatus]|nr:hypothetical protein [Rickettsia endosymbiont of Ixodes persulcatus]